ncbi:MAG: hypothetical protein AAGG51_13495 [Cyanobacteria bacterium P01_G01_bin.54]
MGGAFWAIGRGPTHSTQLQDDSTKNLAAPDSTQEQSDSVALVDGGVITIPTVGIIVIVVGVTGLYIVVKDPLTDVIIWSWDAAVDASRPLREEAGRITDDLINRIGSRWQAARNFLNANKGRVLSFITRKIREHKQYLEARRSVRNPKGLVGNTRQLAQHLARLLRLRRVGGQPPFEPPDPGNYNDNHWWSEIKNKFLKPIQHSVERASRRQAEIILQKDGGFTPAQIADIERRLIEAANMMDDAVPPFLP